ncbi:MAG TPA: HIT domain-containing protein [Acidimicrobiales bacterium]|nr:HIT domain-containing protein [Acidimicrobiales bacterium]
MTELDRLWAGWRSQYIEGVTGQSERPDGCVFCAILASGGPDQETYILWRHPAGTAVAILNAYPYGSGHLMVMPARHCASPEDLGPDEGAAVWQGVTAAVRAIRTAYRADGVNLGANLGRAAGAGIPDHFHMHALPRWSGDTNFMTSVAETRVLPEPLSTSWRKLTEAWPAH